MSMYQTGNSDMEYFFVTLKKLMFENVRLYIFTYILFNFCLIYEDRGGCKLNMNFQK